MKKKLEFPLTDRQQAGLCICSKCTNKALPSKFICEQCQKEIDLSKSEFKLKPIDYSFKEKKKLK